jgi:hypothetical protein
MAIALLLVNTLDNNDFGFVGCCFINESYCFRL